MIKYLFVTINSLVLFFYSLFFDGGGVSVSGNFPATMKTGSEIVVDLVIKKGSMGGFAKLQVEVPAGFTVADVESKGGNFSYQPGMAKWIWTAVPSEAEFTVKFKLQADGSVNGAKTIAAKYSYVENNNKQVAEMPPVEITVGDGAVAATETKTEPVANNNNTSAPETKAPETKTENPSNAGGVSSNEPNSNVSAVRTISEAGPNEWNVNVVIKKDGIKGFARYSDNLPAGFTAKQGKTNGSSFSVADNKIKFVWVNVPTNDEIDISYTLSGTANETMLNGEFSYLENNQSKAYKLTPEKLTAAVAGNIKKTPAEETETKQPETKSEPVATKTPETKQPETKSEPAATQTPETKQPETKSEPVANTTVPETKQPETRSEPSSTQANLETNASRKDGSVSYCVQIGAYQNTGVTASRLTRMYGLSEQVRSEMADGYNKFMIGRHNEYKNARDHRETARGKGCNGAFVAAYNGPKRITVQEALMISNQKWYK